MALRIRELLNDTDYDDEDQAARSLLLGSLNAGGIAHAYPPETRPNNPLDVVITQKTLAVMAPLAEVANRLLANAVMKSQTKGRVSQVAHEWVDQVLSRDLCTHDSWLLVNAHLPLAVASGIEVDAIVAMREGRLADLSAEDRQIVDFVRAVWKGAVTDELWLRQVELIGSERGVVEQICLIMHLVTRIRITQALGGVGISDDELTRMLDGYRASTLPLPDLRAYEKYFAEAESPFKSE
jgi:hypothetical protein